MAKRVAERWGQRGARGERGARGPVGPPGPPGPKIRPAEVLALVDDQFFQIRKQLHLQLERTGQLQVQLDRIQSKTGVVHSLLDEIHGLIRELVKAG